MIHFAHRCICRRMDGHVAHHMSYLSVLRCYIVSMESYIRRTYGYSALSDGNRLFMRGHVIGPDILSDRVFMYHITEGKRFGNVLLWMNENGMPISVVCDLQSERNQYCAAALIAHGHRKSNISSNGDPYQSARNLPVEISEHRLFDLRYELESWYGEDNVEAFEDVVSNFITRVLDSALPPHAKVDCLDIAYDVCASYEGFDASYACTIISDNVHRLYDQLSYADADRIVGILTDVDRHHSRKWLLGDRRCISDRIAAKAYRTLSLMDSISDYDCEVQSLLADIIGDPKMLASMFIIEMSFYEHDRVIRREFGRGHVSVARALTDRIPRNLIVGHELEYARLMREVGLRDDSGLFVTAFYQEPNGKRLIDVLDAHPEMDRDELILNAWDRSPRDIGNLIFFCRNGLGEQVAAYLDRMDDDLILELVNKDRDSVMLLSEVLSDMGECSVSVRFCMSCLDDMVSTAAYDVDSVIHMMCLLDSLYERSGSEYISDYMKDFRCRVRKRSLWEAYSECEGGHF